MGSKPATCRSCGRTVLWVATEPKPPKPSKRMPIDANPDGSPTMVPNGNLVIAGESESGNPIVRYVPSGTGRYVSHFSTCPHADKHRKR